VRLISWTIFLRPGPLTGRRSGPNLASLIAVLLCRNILSMFTGAKPGVRLKRYYQDLEHPSAKVRQSTQGLSHLFLGIRFHQQTGARCVGAVPYLSNEILKIQRTSAFEFIFSKDPKINSGAILT
jgi:hypothetical protein